ncbi:MAG: hypothetical protein ACM31O_03680 [Bacteroidota bacterium]
MNQHRISAETLSTYNVAALSADDIKGLLGSAANGDMVLVERREILGVLEADHRADGFFLEVGPPPQANAFVTHGLLREFVEPTIGDALKHFAFEPPGKIKVHCLRVEIIAAYRLQLKADGTGALYLAGIVN